MKVLTIIVSYNFERWIDKCLGSLRASKHPTDVVVIDNCSKDRTVELIRRDWPEVRLIVNKDNLGFGKANNQGMTIALDEGYDAVFLLNQDAWIDQYALGSLCNLAEQNADFGILSPVHCDGSGKQLDFGFSKYVQLPDLKSLPDRSELITCNFINAAFWFIPTRVIRKIGGFSPLFYHYGEDKDYINRMAYYHYKVGYLPTVVGCHDRAFRKVSEFDFFRAEKVYHLSEFANINYTWARAFAYGVMAGMKKAFQSVMKGKFRYSLKYMSMVCWLLGKSMYIYSIRKQCRTEQRHFV